MKSQLEMLLVSLNGRKKMDWLTSYTDSMDDDEKMFNDFGSLREYLSVPKDHFLYLWPNDDDAGLRGACFIRYLIENLNFEEFNIVMWVSSKMEHTTEHGPWTKTMYQGNELKTFQAVRELSEHLKIPTENVLFLVPGDEFLKDKISEYVSHFVHEYKWSHHTAITWFKVRETYSPSLLKRLF